MKGIRKIKGTMENMQMFHGNRSTKGSLEGSTFFVGCDTGILNPFVVAMPFCLVRDVPRSDPS